ncbi:MAG: dodecin family protein [Limnochordia bacterium]|jgi:flavin-binding protein dodecin
MSDFEVASIIELVGESEKSWEDAVSRAVDEAAKTVKHIQGVEVLNMTAVVEQGKVVKYKADCHVSFGVDDGLRDL